MLRSLFALTTSLLLTHALILSKANSETSAPASEYDYEVRTLIGVQSSNAENLNQGLHPEIQARQLVKFGADWLFEIRSWSLGIRYDSISSIKKFDENFSRYLEIAVREFSLVVRRRWIADSFYYGPYGTIGLYLPSDVIVRREPGDQLIRYTAGSTRSAALGLEAGWILSEVYLIGGEAGYQYLVLDSFRGQDGSQLTTPSGVPIRADLSGLHFKFLLGVRF